MNGRADAAGAQVRAESNCPSVFVRARLVFGQSHRGILGSLRELKYCSLILAAALALGDLLVLPSACPSVRLSAAGARVTHAIYIVGQIQIPGRSNS